MENNKLEGFLPQKVIDYLYDGQFFSINDTIYRGMVLIDSKTDEKYVDFVETSKSYVNTVCYEPSKDGKKNMAASNVIRDHELSMMNFIPCNIKNQYQYIYRNLVWNKYNAPVHTPKEVTSESDIEKKCKNTLRMFRHVYGEMLDIALDYATVEYMLPKQPLPVQVLFSTHNNTGKSTILLHRRAIYGKNASVMSIENFEDKFNSTVVGKNCVLIDEGELDPKALVKLKMLVTSPVIMLREMFRSAVEVPNYAKYYFTTNKKFFAKLDGEDSRFWVTLVPKLSEKDLDPELLDKIEAEIPHWLGFLKKRWELRFDKSVKSGILKMHTNKKRSRLWFLEKDYITDALLNLKRLGITVEAKNILNDIVDWFDTYNKDKEGISAVTEFYCNTKMLKNKFYKNNAKIGLSVIRKILEDDLKLETIKNEKGAEKNVRFINYLGDDEHSNGAGSEVVKKYVYNISYDYCLKKLSGDVEFTDDIEDVTPKGIIEAERIKNEGVQTEVEYKNRDYEKEIRRIRSF